MKEGGRNVTTVLGRKGISSSSSSYFVARFTITNTYAKQPLTNNGPRQSIHSRKKNTHTQDILMTERKDSIDCQAERNGSDYIDRDNRSATYLLKIDDMQRVEIITSLVKKDREKL